MAEYNYKCTNLQCPKRNETIEIQKPMSVSDRDEVCEECKENLKRIYGSPGIKTGDGVK